MLDEKKMLIDSMKKLIVHISNNKEHQNEIYRSLTKNDIVKIISNLEDSNGSIVVAQAVLRKMSARLLCQLLYDNEDLKQLFVQTMSIVPGYGNIVLNKFPEALLARPQHIIEIMRFLKTARLPPSSEKEICWFIDADRPDHSLQLVTHSSFPIHEFLDPARVLIGITYVKKDASRNRIGYPEFGINQSHIGITKSVRVRSDAMNHSIGGGYTERERDASQDFDKLIRSGRDESVSSKGVTPMSDKVSGKKDDISFTERFYRPEEHGRYSVNNSTGITMQSHIVGKRLTDEGSQDANRIRTDESDNSFLRGRPKQGLKLLSGAQIATTTSPQSAQPYTSRMVDKILRDKANNKDDKQVIVLGGNKEASHGRTLTDRDAREPPEPSIPTPKGPLVSNYLIRGNYTVNNFGREYNNYTPTSDIRDIKRTIGETRPSHESSFQGGYKPSEIFLKKIKDSAKK